MHDVTPDIGTRPAGLAGEDIAARVVLLGQTGLDGRLRLDPSIELIRVRSGFDAVGELANPVLPTPGRTMVIVGDESSLPEQIGGPTAFITSVRRVAPDAVVVACPDPTANSAPCAAYDTVVSRHVSTEELRSLVHGDDVTPPRSENPGAPADRAPAGAKRPASASSETVQPGEAGADLAPRSGEVELERGELEALRMQNDDPADPRAKDQAGDPSVDQSVGHSVGHSGDPARDHDGVTPPADAPRHAPRHAPTHEPPDESTHEPALPLVESAELKPVHRAAVSDADGVLIAALLGGRDLLEPALGLIQARTGLPDAAFVPANEADRDAVAGAASVEWGRLRFGWLTAGGLTPESIKDDGPSEVLAAEARWLGSWLALARSHRELRMEALTDPVSGAWNRRYFDRFLATAIPHARSRRHKLTVLVFDLDNFKSFNDRFGHEAGDSILSETVSLMRSMTRPTDRICRIGGDEFAVIFYEPEGPRDKNSDHPDDFEVVAARFQRAVVEQRFPKLGIELPGELTISGGLATFPWDGQTADELLRRADQLALASKRSGKNQITFGSSVSGGTGDAGGETDAETGPNA